MNSKQTRMLMLCQGFQYRSVSLKNPGPLFPDSYTTANSIRLMDVYMVRVLYCDAGKLDCKSCFRFLVPLDEFGNQSTNKIITNCDVRCLIMI